MTKMINYVEDLQARLSEVTRTEQTLIRALGEALSRVDQELLADVRDLTLSHEARRVAILEELQNLAARIGAFPVAAPPARQALEATGPVLAPEAAVSEQPDSVRAGDWRKAVSNIKEELDGYFGRGVQH